VLGSEGPRRRLWDRLLVVRGWRGEDAAPGCGVGLGVGGGDRVDWLLPPATAAGEDSSRIEENRRWDSEDVIDRLSATG